MSNRSADSAALKPGNSASERRKNAGQRLHFEALIAMADTQGGAGFEAESVDMSSGGMRLRTAYVPPVGEKLVCRFDNAGQEITVTGEVLWRNEQPRGGEFGIRFVDVDKETAEILRKICVAPKSEGEAGSAPGSSAMRGTRVRLHIEGLGSPMKARVREADTGEMLVGSNLEFLKVGRTLELEDVDHGTRREAFIDHVKVDIDGATNIPQLVVSLRYAEGEKGARAAAVAGKASGASKAAQGSAEKASAKAQSKSIPDNSESILQSPPNASSEDAHKSEMDASDADHEIDADLGEEERTGKLVSFGRKASHGAKSVAGAVGPALLSASAKTKEAMAGLFGAIAKKRAEKAESDQPAAPRRTTAPPPTGALRSEGKRLVRDDQGDDELEEAAPPKMNRKAAIFGSALGLLAVLAIFGVTRFMAAKAPASDATAATAEDQSNAALSAAPSAPAMLPPGAAPTGVLTVDVPLFGATPLSTTEPVPPPPDPSALAAVPPGMPGAVPNPAGDNAAADLPEPSLSDQAGDDDENEGNNSGPAEPGQKQFGQGKVKNPIVLRLKMDGPVEQVNGASGAMGFTISLPGRRSLSTSSELARKDKRIASFQVVNTAQGAEITVQFKDGVPSYLAKAKGNKLEIALGTPGKKKVASKEGGDKKKQADKKKSQKSVKKDSSKKKTKKPAH